MSEKNEEDINEENQHTIAFFINLQNHIKGMKTDHLHPIRIIQALMSVAVQGASFSSSIENFRAALHVILDTVIDHSIQFGLIKKEDDKNV